MGASAQPGYGVYQRLDGMLRRSAVFLRAGKGVYRNYAVVQGELAQDFGRVMRSYAAANYHFNFTRGSFYNLIQPVDAIAGRTPMTRRNTAGQCSFHP